MPTSIPLTFRAGPFPAGYNADPEQLKNDIVARLYAESTDAISFFASGSVAPSSNVGPWLKNGQEWYVWSDVSASYIAQVIPYASLRYIAQVVAPDQNIYTLWIELNGTGKALAIKYYSGGAWKDIYEDKFALYQTVAGMSSYSDTTAMNAAIAAAVGSIPSSSVGQGIFRAKPSVVQNIIFGAGGNQTGAVSLATTVINPDSSFAASKFTAPASGYYTFSAMLYSSVSAGTPTDIDIRGFFLVNGAADTSLNDEPISTSLAGRGIVGTAVIQLAAGDEVELGYDITIDAAGTVTIDDANTFLAGYRVR